MGKGAARGTHPVAVLVRFRPYRTYYHSRTYQPVRLDELNMDSEDELDLDWLAEATSRVRTAARLGGAHAGLELTPRSGWCWVMVHS